MSYFKCKRYDSRQGEIKLQVIKTRLFFKNRITSIIFQIQNARKTITNFNRNNVRKPTIINIAHVPLFECLNPKKEKFTNYKQHFENY